MKDHRRSLFFAIKQIDDEVAFVPHKVTSNFSSLSSFSALDLRLAVHVNDAHRDQLAIRVTDLFTVEDVDAGTSELEFIAHSRRKIWPPFNPSNTKRKETDIMLSLCREVFMPLCREVLLERKYDPRVSQIPKLQAGDLGLGSVNTWHGTPDARLRGMEVVWRKDSGEEIVSDNEGSVQSDGTSTEVEGKVLSKEVNLPQAVGTCVVASFTSKTRHPERKVLVPTVLIDEKQSLWLASCMCKTLLYHFIAIYFLIPNPDCHYTRAFAIRTVTIPGPSQSGLSLPGSSQSGLSLPEPSGYPLLQQPSLSPVPFPLQATPFLE